MKILILGVSGLIGHTLLRELSATFNIYGTLHKQKDQYNTDFFENYEIIPNVDVLEFELLHNIICKIQPAVIINCIGITRRKINTNNLHEAISVNSCFPHRLAKFAKKRKIRVIHFSTDCVFNGELGNYNESDLTTAEDTYGRTKALGEINTYENCLTIRSSFIGQELFDKTELLDWFLAQKGKSIKGFQKTLYSGVSTIFMTTVIKEILLNFPNLNGLYNLAPAIPISKFDLLCIAKEKFQIGVEIIPECQQVHTPTLDGSKLKNRTGIIVPPWDDMMNKLAQHKLDYEK